MIILINTSSFAIYQKSQSYSKIMTLYLLMWIQHTNVWKTDFFMLSR